MISFIKEHFNVFIKCNLNQFGSAILGLMLAFMSANSPKIFVLSSCFCVCFYMFLLYSYMWDLGAKDIIRVEGKRLEYKPLKGLYFAIYGNIINILIGLFVLIFGLLGAENLSNLAWAANICAVSKVIGLFWEAMYMGIINHWIPSLFSAFLIIVIPSLIACSLGYYAGLKNFRIIKKTSKKS